MNKKPVTIILVIALLASIGAAVYFAFGLGKAKLETKEMQELMELDRMEMENEYRGFTLQYDELKNKIQNDTLAQQLNAERQRAQQLLEELERVKANDANYIQEIKRLRQELADVRSVMRQYLIKIDSLQRINQELREENLAVKTQIEQADKQITNLSHEREQLKETVSIASQLNATQIIAQPRRKGKKNDKASKVDQILINFAIDRNPTAKTGGRNAYIRIIKPDNTVLTNGETCTYQNKSVEISIKKYIEYEGEELQVSGVWNVTEYLLAGTYRIGIIVDGNLIGESSFQLK